MRTVKFFLSLTPRRYGVDIKFLCCAKICQSEISLCKFSRLDICCQKSRRSYSSYFFKWTMTDVGMQSKHLFSNFEEQRFLNDLEKCKICQSWPGGWSMETRPRNLYSFAGAGTVQLYNCTVRCCSNYTHLVSVIREPLW